MNRTFRSEWDSKRYGQLIDRTLRFVRRGGLPLIWCVTLGSGLHAFACWLHGDGLGSTFLSSGFLILFLLLFCLIRRFQVRQYVKVVERLMSGGAVSECHLTDACYEVSCGELSQKLPWKNLATHYHFFDDDTMALICSNGQPSLVLWDLSKHGVDRRELEAVLRQAELKEVGESKKRKIRAVVSWGLGVAFVALAALALRVSVLECRCSVRCWDTQVRLFDLIHGESDPRRPVFGISLRARVVRLLVNAGEPDECLYLFVPDEENDKVGLYARYGEWSCEAYFPCGCACVQNPGYFDHIKQLHKPTVYLEQEKSAWMEKVRPIANDLYEPEDEDEPDDADE